MPTNPTFKRILWYLIGGTVGGVNRARIIEFISMSPANANQISVALSLDYKTVIHHLLVLTKNGLIITDRDGKDGAIYFLTPRMEDEYSFFTDIMIRTIENGVEYGRAMRLRPSLQA